MTGKASASFVRTETPFFTSSLRGVAQNNAGKGSEINSIAAVVIGGASLFGGAGTVFGTFIGVSLIPALVTGLILAGVQPFWETVLTGLVIIGAVCIDQLRDRMRFSAP